MEVRFYDQEASIKRKAVVELDACDNTEHMMCELLTFLAQDHNAMQVLF